MKCLSKIFHALGIEYFLKELKLCVGLYNIVSSFMDGTNTWGWLL